MGGHEMFSVLWRSAMFVRRKICFTCLTVLGETADRRGKINDPVFPSMERETMFAKQLIIMDVILFVFESYL
jgi:hypothetical protein